MSLPSNPILQLLQKKLIPWMDETGMDRITIARPLARQMMKVPNARLTPKPRKGKRVAARGKNHHEILAHWHDDHQVEIRSLQLVFVTSGQADLHFGNYILHCNQGEGVFIPAGVPKPMGPHPHLEGERRLHGACELLWFRPFGRRVQAWICHSRGELHYGSQTRETVFTLDDRLLRLFEDIERELREMRSGYTEICNHLLRTFLLLLQRDLEEERFLYPSSVQENESSIIPNYNPIDRAQQYIRDHLHENLTLESVARVVYLSRAQFAQRFHRETGQTFTAFVTQCRLEQAVIMLRDTSFTMIYICRVLGYRSPTYFNDLFRRHFEMSPLEFRKQSRKDRELVNKDDNKKK